MNLDSTQRDIVTSSAKNIIVSAGAGSGKTRVLTERVKYLLESGVSPDSIVCITFTNKAADEMKQRLADVSGIGDAFIGTIHSFANRILKNSGKPYDILTQEKSLEIMKYLIEKYAHYVTFDTYMSYVDVSKDVKLGIRDEKDITDMFYPSTLHEINILKSNTPKDDYPETLYSVCEARNILTFDQLLAECTSYYASIGGNLEYLLVDELQDIGDSEYEFIMGLSADNNFFVGDDWQSIYGFKGGDVRYFLRLMEDPTWSTYYLNNNYRNSKSILDIAKTVIYQADKIINKEVVAVRDEEGKVVIDTKQHLRDYLNAIKSESDTNAYKDWFVLVRSNKDVHEVSAHLLSMNIPFVSFKQGGSTNDDINYQMNLDAVKVLTVHSAKGLESKNVILYGNFPIRQKNYLRNSDERKVMYVGITRAEDLLVILN